MCARVVAEPGWWCMQRRVSPCVFGVERVEAMHGQSEAGDPIEQPVEMRRVDDRPHDVRPAVVGGERHSVKGGCVTRPELSLDDDAVAVR